MTDRPILFSGSMVRAIRDGRKTQTRRIIKPQLVKLTELPSNPYGNPGDRLWVRENCWAHKDTGEIFAYCAVDETLYSNNKTVKKVPSIHMPRWASRITLEIAGVRVNRLHDISEEDAIAEGIGQAIGDGLYRSESGSIGRARTLFQSLWQSINGPDSWDENPGVWVIDFKKLEP